MVNLIPVIKHIRTLVGLHYECRWSIIDLQALSDAIFFGLGNLGLKIVAMSYEISLCFGSTQSENQLRTYGGQTARANMRSPITRNIGRFFGRPDRAIQRTGYRITLTRHKLLE